MAVSNELLAGAVQTEERACGTHGVYIARNFLGKLWSGCPICTELAEQSHREQREAAREKERLDGRLAQSGLGGRFAEAGFDDFVVTAPEQAVVLSAARQFAESCDGKAWGAPWLIGPPGTGKTLLASAMVRTVIVSGKRPAHIATSRGLIRRLRATWGKRASESETEVLDELAAYSLLVIDEAGTGSGTPAELDQILDIVDSRYRLERPTALVSNHPVAELRKALGDRLFDRLREGARVLACNWESHRGARHE